MDEFVSQVEASNINYNPAFRNSNGVAYGLVEAAGLSHPSTHPRSVPGYNDIVYRRATNQDRLPPGGRCGVIPCEYPGGYPGGYPEYIY
jgi:hypothetical protein